MIISNIHDNFKQMFQKIGLSRPKLEGSFVNGTIISKEQNILTMYTGLKTTTEFVDKELDTIKKNIHLTGTNNTTNLLTQTFPVYIQNIENVDEEMVVNQLLYQEKNKVVTAWKRVNELEYVRGIVLNTVSGGFSVGIGGIVAFLPKSRIKMPKRGKKKYIQTLMNTYCMYKIIKVNYVRRNIVVSLANEYS